MLRYRYLFNILKMSTHTNTEQFRFSIYGCAALFIANKAKLMPMDVGWGYCRFSLKPRIMRGLVLLFFNSGGL